ncbi:hypothetical protein PTW35_12070 [Photobacterium sp. DA100]|uniref:hypothetical protein n=1 Tax=Photobacterium sp. DA100 TaxID=3027472 RepID=UPI00247AA1C3|nr:hypothetical protein [Photobacterium sp. DA100]WEM41361.1 hypothetical protein PTW35_12070 [Photobacterium sp. DA100]
MLVSVLDFLFTVSGIGVLLSIIGFILMMIFAKRLNPTIINVMVINFVIALALMVSLPQLGRAELRSRLADGIDSISSDEAFNRNLMAERLTNIKYVIGSNSHPKERFDIVVYTKREEILLQLARDSVEQSTYWVYYPKYRFFTINEVGKVRL